jgi:hypothetical protein
MKISNLTTTKLGYTIRALVINESRTVLIGKVQDKTQLRKEGEEIVFIPAKWDIDRENKICVCQLGIPEYDISLENKYIPPLPEAEKPKKNFYTFKKTAWHCKFYKWVFGKEPHKVHPTMCPYFWIMVVVFLTLPLVLLIKLTGKGGVKFMESCTTYSRRREEARREKFRKYCDKNVPDMTDEQIYAFRQSKLYQKYKYEVQRSMYKTVEDGYSRWYWHLEDLKEAAKKKRWEEEHLRDLLLQSQREAKERLETVAFEKREIRNQKIKEFRQTKTSKIIGVLMILIFGGLTLWGLSLTVVAVVVWVNWYWVGMALLGICGVVLLLGSLYVLFRYIVNPSVKWIFLAFGRIKFPKMPPIPAPKIKAPKWNLGKKASIAFTFLFGWIPKLGRLFINAFVYMIDFFKMGGDLIHSTYKKNCPRITWVDTDENQN